MNMPTHATTIDDWVHPRTDQSRQLREDPMIRSRVSAHRTDTCETEKKTGA